MPRFESFSRRPVSRGRRPRLVGTSQFQGGCDDDLFTVQLNYRTDVDGRDVVLSAEHDAFTWQPLHELDRGCVDAYNLDVVRQALTAT